MHKDGRIITAPFKLHFNAVHWFICINKVDKKCVENMVFPSLKVISGKEAEKIVRPHKNAIKAELRSF